MRDPEALTNQEVSFAEAYVACGIAAESYRRAYNTHANAASHAVLGKRVLDRPRVQKYIAKLRETVTANAVASSPQVLLDLERTLLENARIGFFDPRELFIEGTERIKPPSEWPDHVAANIAGVEVHTLHGEGADGKGPIGTVAKVKFWNKNNALDQLMRHFGAYEKDNQQKAKSLLDGLPRETVKLIQEGLRELALKRDAVVGTVTARSAVSTERGD